MKFDWLIVGAGFTGVTLAERIATQLDKRVLVIDRRQHIGGNAYDEYSVEGIQVHRYGPHIFHTNSVVVFNYLSNFTSWRPYMHHVAGVINGKKVPIPFNLNSLYQLFPNKFAEQLESKLIEAYGFNTKIPVLKMREAKDKDLQFLAEFIYQNVFLNYTKKQWDLTPEELDPAVTGRVPVYISRDDRYFQDRFQVMPIGGYTEMFRRMLSHKNIKVLLNTDYREIINDLQFNRMIYTGPVDEYFDHCHGSLPYRSLRFEFKNLNTVQFQDVGTVNYPNDYSFTRITELKYLSGQTSDMTTLVYEYPEVYELGRNEPYYPIPRVENRELYARYEKEMEKLHAVTFVGRLADYKYYNMDQACARALKIFETDLV
jgi:UDP-galactopyranose mutase